MKKLISLILLLAIAGFGMVSSVSAGSAYLASFTTSVTYQNLSSDSASIVFEFFPENSSTSVTHDVTVAGNAGGSLYVGNVTSISSGFNGSAIMSSNKPIIATMVQISSDADVKNRPLSNGFSSGSSEILLASVLKNQFNTTSRFSVQNVHTGAVDLTVSLFNADNPGAAPITITHNNLPSGAAKYFDMGTLSEVTAGNFNGSATITAVQAGTSTPANIVGTVLELSTTGGAASAVEAVDAGSTTIYMPSALCDAFGGQNSAYAIQNTDSSTVNVTVNYNGGGSESANIAPGAKKSFIGCTANSAGYSGSATITANGDIVGLMKVFGGSLSTAALGASEGHESLSCPYVRWTESQYNNGGRQRAFIAIQNIGSGISAGDVTVTYRDKDGNAVGTHTLGALSAGAKTSTWAGNDDVVGNASNLDEFGYVGGFGGGVTIDGPSGSELVAIVRIQSVNAQGQVVAEDASCMSSN